MGFVSFGSKSVVRISGTMVLSDALQAEVDGGEQHNDTVPPFRPSTTCICRVQSIGREKIDTDIGGDHHNHGRQWRATVRPTQNPRLFNSALIL